MVSLVEILSFILTGAVLFVIGYNSDNLKRMLIASVVAFFLAIALYSFLTTLFGPISYIAIPILMFFVIAGEIYRERRKSREPKAASPTDDF